MQGVGDCLPARGQVLAVEVDFDLGHAAFLAEGPAGTSGLRP